MSTTSKNDMGALSIAVIYQHFSLTYCRVLPVLT
jgi:hypothetical protein